MAIYSHLLFTKLSKYVKLIAYAFKSCFTNDILKVLYFLNKFIL